jgi:hypothetical protein
VPAAWSALVAHYKSKCNLTTDAEAEERIRIDVAAGNGGSAVGSPPVSAPAPACAVKPAQPVPRVKPTPKPTAVVASLKLKPIQASPAKNHNAVPNTVVAPRAQHGSSSKLPPLTVPASSASRVGHVHDSVHDDTSPPPPPPASPPSQQKYIVHEPVVVVDDTSREVVAVVSVTSHTTDTPTKPLHDHPASSANRTADSSNEIEHGMSSCLGYIT